MWKQQLKNIKLQRFTHGINNLIKFTDRIDKSNSAHIIYFRDNLPQYMAIIFGDNNNKGWMTQCYQQVMKEQNPRAFEYLNLLTNFLSPKIGAFYKLIFNTVHSNCFLDIAYLPDYIKKEIQSSRNSNLSPNPLQLFCKVLQNNQNFMKSNQLTITIPQWFLIMFIIKMKEFIPHIRNLKGFENFMVDQFYYDFMRNPFLIVIRRYLKYFHQNQKKQEEKLITFIRQYFIKDYVKIIKLKDSSNVRYPKLIEMPKCHILQTVYFTINYCYSKLKSQEMYSYFHTLAQNWSGVCHSVSISDIIRVWLFCIYPQNSFEKTLIQVLENNEKKKIKKYQFSEGQRSDRQYSNKLNKCSIQFYTNLFNLFITAIAEQKTQFTYRHLYSINLIFQVLGIDKNSFIKDKLKINISTYEQGKINSKKILSKIQFLYRNIIQKSNQIKIPSLQYKQLCDNITTYNKLISEGFLNLYELSNLQVSIQQKDMLTLTNRLLIKHVPTKFKNEWQNPIAPNEIRICYYLFFMIAKLIDLILMRDLGGYPKTNLRPLISQTNLLVIILIILVFVIVFYRN